MERIVNKKYPLTNEQKAFQIALGYYNQPENDDVIVAVESKSVFLCDTDSIREWAKNNKQTLVVVKKDGKLLIGENSEVEEPKEEKPKKKNK